MTVASQRPRWARLLRLLDAEAAGEAVAETDSALLHEAKAMVLGGYLEILLLVNSRTDTD